MDDVTEVKKGVVELLDSAISTLENATGRTHARDAESARLDIIAARTRLSVKETTVQRASRVLYQEMDSWATFEKGVVRVEVIVDLMKQEGMLRDATGD